MYKSYCAVVSQHDRTWTFLTAREHLESAVAFCQASLTKAARQQATESLLEQMGLTSCADLQAGTDIPDEMGPTGLSGGQRRRLSLAIALAKKPGLLIADEPTSGLDSASAAAIMQVMRSQALVDRMAVICTIHQPSASIFECMDQLLILSKGCTVYYGDRRMLAQHMVALDKAVPSGMSITEHMLNIVNSDFAPDEDVNAVIEAWHKLAPPHLPLPEASVLPAEPARARSADQLWILLVRHSKLVLRDPLVFIMLLTMSIIDLCIVNLYFWNELRTNDQRRGSALVLVTCNCAAMPMLYNSVLSFSTSMERVRVSREINLGMYSPALYVTVNTAILLPITLLIGLVTTVELYLWADIHWDAYPYHALAMGAAQFWMASIAQLCGWLCGPTAGTSVFLVLWTAAYSTHSCQEHAKPAAMQRPPTSCPPMPASSMAQFLLLLLPHRPILRHIAYKDMYPDRRTGRGWHVPRAMICVPA